MIVRSYPTLHIFSVGRYSSLPSLAVLLKSVEKKKNHYQDSDSRMSRYIQSHSGSTTEQSFCLYGRNTN